MKDFLGFLAPYVAVSCFAFMLGMQLDKELSRTEAKQNEKHFVECLKKNKGLLPDVAFAYCKPAMNGEEIQ